MPVDYDKHRFTSPLFRSVVEDAVSFFTQTPVQNLPPEEQFIGVGVYALYYIGQYDLYSKLVDPSYNRPIYVGKAVPEGWRTARAVQSERGAILYGRLRQHARSIGHTKNLSITDFRARFVILSGIESDLIIPIEAALIRRYRPLWNSAVDGFGNHDPGSGRYNQARSEWDILHPGRPWADRLTGQSTTLDEILRKIDKYIENQSS
jgi:hypothetical protein